MTENPRFPELHIILRRKGADIIAVPSAFTLKTGKDHWCEHPNLMTSQAINFRLTWFLKTHWWYVVASL